MASISPATISSAKSLGSDHLRSSNSCINGVQLRELGRTRLLCSGKKKIDLSVSAKLRKVKKNEYPWPEDPDPNVKGGVLTHLSPFKPLKTKPKPVTLDFEKPLMDLQKKIIDVSGYLCYGFSWGVGSVLSKFGVCLVSCDQVFLFKYFKSCIAGKEDGK